MSEHAYLPAMVGFMRNHVAQHFRPNRPRPGPAVSEEHLDASTTAERFRKHLRAASTALSQRRTRLRGRAMRALELSRNFQMRRREPDPLAADIVHVGEDRRNGAGLAGRFGPPRGRFKMFDQNLVHPFVGSKNLDRGSAQLRVNLVSSHSHGSYSFHHSNFRTVGNPQVARRLGQAFDLGLIGGCSGQPLRRTDRTAFYKALHDKSRNFRPASHRVPRQLLVAFARDGIAEASAPTLVLALYKSTQTCCMLSVTTAVMCLFLTFNLSIADLCWMFPPPLSQTLNEAVFNDSF